MKTKSVTRSILFLSIILLPKLSFAQETPDLAIIGNDDQSISGQVNFLNKNNKEELFLYKKPKPVPPWFVRRIKVSAGGVFPINNTKIEVGNQSGTFGTELDFENDLGFNKSTTTFLSDIQWRASRRSRFDLSYFYLNRNTSYQLQKTIEFGDHTYPVDASVNSFFKTNIYRFSYGYAFFLDPKYEFGLMIGAHVLKTEVGIGLLGATAEIGYRDDFDFTAPLPDAGIWGGYAVSDKFAVTGNLSYLSLKINDISGKIISYNLSIIYNVVPNLEVAAGYTGLNFTVDVQKERLQGYFKWGYNGPFISASYSFGKKKPFE